MSCLLRQQKQEIQIALQVQLAVLDKKFKCIHTLSTSTKYISSTSIVCFLVFYSGGMLDFHKNNRIVKQPAGQAGRKSGSGIVTAGYQKEKQNEDNQEDYRPSSVAAKHPVHANPSFQHSCYSKCGWREKGEG
jgi:hypothetical protein